MTTIPRGSLAAIRPCINGLNHVFVKETRQHNDSATLVDDRLACQRCTQPAIGFDWDGPFQRVVLTEENG